MTFNDSEGRSMGPQPATSTSTSRERFRRVWDFQPVDRPPAWEAIAIWGDTMKQWQDEGGLPRDVEWQDHFALDRMPCVHGGLGLAAMAISGPEVQWRTVEETPDCRVTESDLGAVKKERLDGTSMPQFLRFPVESHEHWLGKIKPRLTPEGHEYPRLEKEVAECRRYSDLPQGVWLVGLYAFLRMWWGEEKLAYAFYDFPDTLHDMADVWRRMLCECGPRVVDSIDADYVMFHEDMAFKNGPLIGPDLYRQFIKPYYEDVVSMLQGKGMHRFAIDSDGNNGPLQDLFIEVGFNGLFPFEQAAGNDVLDIRKRYPRFVIFGGIDKRVLNGSKDDIRREVMSKVPQLWEVGGFIPSIDHAVQPCPQENFEYFLEIVRSCY